MEKSRKNYNTTLRTDLLKEIKILAIKEDRRVNDLLEEAIEDLLDKYSDNSSSTDKPK
ncbi:MAG: ribbon-helix-helix domain-containing protein [Desulfobacterales bacterium]